MIKRIEKKAIELLLAGNDPMLIELRNQYNTASIKNIEMTGVGVYINYSIHAKSIKLQEDCHFCFGDIEGKLDSLNNGIGFLLCIDKGVLSFLEIYTYDEPWPDQIKEFEINYIDGIRNIDELHNSWSIFQF